MKKTLTTFAAAAVIAAAAATAPTQADARSRGGAVAAGIIGGLAAGAIIAGAANPYPHYGYGYYGAPAYYPAYGPGCVIQRERVWNGYRWVRRNVRVCY